MEKKHTKVLCLSCFFSNYQFVSFRGCFLKFWWFKQSRFNVFIFLSLCQPFRCYCQQKKSGRCSWWCCGGIFCLYFSDTTLLLVLYNFHFKILFYNSSFFVYFARGCLRIQNIWQENTLPLTPEILKYPLFRQLLWFFSLVCTKWRLSQLIFRPRFCLISWDVIETLNLRTLAKRGM